MDISQVTPLVLTYNEAPNLERTLNALWWASEVIVLDSGSTDATADIAARYPNVRVHSRPFDDHTAQCNYGLTLTRTEWVLSLDADYVMPAEFLPELKQIEPTADTNAYFAGFVYCVFGEPLRVSLYPARAVLFRRARATYVPDGHTQRLRFAGEAGKLSTRIRHDDRKSLSHWLAAQDRYAALEAHHLLSLPPRELRRRDRLRRQGCLAPWAVFFYLAICKGLIMTGWRGWFYVMQRTVAELILSLHIIAARQRS